MADDDTLSEEDRALFRDAVASAQRLRHDRVEHARRPRSPHPEQTLADEQRVLRELLEIDPLSADLETGDELIYLRAGIQRRVLRKLRRGQFSVGAELDLHGLTAAAAKQELAHFLREARTRGLRCVRVVHGKGLRSPNGRPVLKAKLDRWLRQRREVVAFCSTPPTDGGTGAVYVLLAAH